MKKNYFITLLCTLCFVGFSFGQTPIITAIVDGDCSGGNPKLLEIYADGAVDFSLYTLQNQTNSNTTWGSDQDLSSLGTVTDAFVYITTSGSATALGTEFPSITGSTPTLVTGTMSINGDDRIRIILTSDSSVIDQYGVSDTDGTNESWEYVDSYAKRKDGTGPDTGFNATNWTFGGASILDTLGTCQGGADTFETLMGGIGTYSTTASSSPTINSSGSVTSLDYFENNGPSAEGNFTVSGTNLTAAITVTAPANFEVSLTSGSGFANSVNVSQSGGTANETTVYVRLMAGLTSNTYTGDITMSSAGATDKTLSVTGIVSPDDPQITVTTSLDDLNYNISTGGPSTEDNFTVSGLFLTNDLIITAPTNFEVSLTSGSGFASSVSITPSSGIVVSTMIYVRLAAGLTEGNYTGDITVSSTGLTSQTVALNGNVFGAITNSMVITGVYDGPLTGGTPKGVELYVLKDIADLSLFGVSSVSNGGGSTAGNVEFTFPAVSATAGTFIYVATESTNFTTFFGMAPTYTTGVVGINGDDSIELYESGQIIDVFGDVDTDGTGEVWEYRDGWAYRNADTGPEGTTFTPTNWTYSGADALDGESDNASAATPFPIGTYTNATASVKDNSIEGFSAYPNPVTNKSFTIKSLNSSTKEITIFNVLGKKVLHTTFSGVQKTVDVSSLNLGIYILKVIEDGKSSTKKLVIR